MNRLARKNRDIILQVAAQHFAEKGYGGARMDEIADAAGVNKATIYYKIGNKLALYQFVVNESLQAVFEYVTQSVETADGLENQLEAYIRAFCIALTQYYPYAPRLMMREIANQGQYLPLEAMHSINNIMNLLKTILLKGGKASKGPNPYLLHTIIIGSLHFIIGTQGMRKQASSGKNKALPKEAAFSIEEALPDFIRFITMAVKAGE